jgi:DNA polymerase-3 subunit delta'
MLRESLVVEHQHQGIMRVTNNELKFVEDFGRLLKIDQISLLAEEFDKAHYHLERNANAKILFLNLSVTIAKTIN